MEPISEPIPEPIPIVSLLIGQVPGSRLISRSKDGSQLGLSKPTDWCGSPEENEGLVTQLGKTEEDRFKQSCPQ